MARLCQKVKNEERKELVAKYAEKRQALKKIINHPNTPMAERDEAARKLRSLPRDSSATRVRNRCSVTGRSRGYYRKFGISRIALRDLFHAGELPGVRKASW